MGSSNGPPGVSRSSETFPESREVRESVWIENVTMDRYGHYTSDSIHGHDRVSLSSIQLELDLVR